VNQLGYDSWPEQISHADWHPGNMLFADHKVAAILDFDSVRVAPAVTDLANGMLQFSIVAGRPNPAEWPEYLDQRKLANFLAGYMEVAPLEADMVNALPDLMIEAMVAEPVLPIAATGFFGYLKGGDFLKMIHCKCNWIDENRELIIEKAEI
jgi:Ser/Thr protein kinase RdoA (MazF antagonist)